MCEGATYVGAERTGLSDDHRDGPPKPDYRFSLANERTFLAYLRTALALDVAALAVVQFFPDLASPGVRRIAAVLLASTGLMAILGGYRRWVLIQRAMQRGEPLPHTSLPILLVATMAIASLLAIALTVVG